MVKTLMANGLKLSLGAIYLAGALALGSASTRAEPADFVFDPEHTYITFFVSHLGLADVAGMFLESRGSFRYDEENKKLASLKFTIKTDSVFTNHKKRDEHLRSADFLNSSEFPEITFVATKAEKLSDSTGKVTGDLTVLGVTRPVTLDVTLNGSGNYPFGDEHYAIGIHATGSFKRSDFGMTYGIDSNFVGDEVKLVIGFEGIRQ